MNPIWVAMVVLSIITAILGNRVQAVNSSILTQPAEAVMFCLKLMGNMCLWLGIMKVAERAGLIAAVSRVVRPVIRLIFPDIPVNHPAFAGVTASLVANMMGIGNAATAFGLKAMKELQTLAPDDKVATNPMCAFIIANSFMIQIIHSNTLFIRNLMGSPNPTAVMPAIIFTTFLTFIAGNIIVRLYQRMFDVFGWGR